MSRIPTTEREEHALAPVPNPRFLSRDDCLRLAKRAAAVARGGGDTKLFVESTWTGNVSWARNQITANTDVQNHTIDLCRVIRGAGAGETVTFNQVDDAAIEAAVRRAERLRLRERDAPPFVVIDPPYTEPYQLPELWSEQTYQLDAAARTDAVRGMVQSAEQAGLLSAGYIEVSAHGRGAINASGQALYYPFTLAQCSVTVRDPQGTASGWAGVDANDWRRIDPAHLAAVARDKCLRARNPVAIEPGRYTAILEPQAVADLVWELFRPGSPPYGIMDRGNAETDQSNPFWASPDQSKIGEQVIDARLTIRANPMDPACGFPPFNVWGLGGDTVVYHPATWFDQGVLHDLAYDRGYGIHALGQNAGLPSSGAFHMSGGTTSVDEMIATTRRGVLVTRFWAVEILDRRSMLLVGYTRDGLWLIEHGKISKPVKNFRFVDSVLLVLNHILALGPPQRVFHPYTSATPFNAPIVVPPLKVEDFNFASLADAV